MSSIDPLYLLTHQCCTVLSFKSVAEVIVLYDNDSFEILEEAFHYFLPNNLNTVNTFFQGNFVRHVLALSFHPMFIISTNIISAAKLEQKWVWFEYFTIIIRALRISHLLIVV